MGEDKRAVSETCVRDVMVNRVVAMRTNSVSNTLGSVFQKASTTDWYLVFNRALRNSRIFTLRKPKGGLSLP